MYADTLDYCNQGVAIFQDKFNALHKHIDIATRNTQIAEIPAMAELDALGTKLWNACTRTLRKDGIEDITVDFLSRGQSCISIDISVINCSG